MDSIYFGGMRRLDEQRWEMSQEVLLPWKALELGYSYEMLHLEEVLSVPFLPFP